MNTYKGIFEQRHANFQRIKDLKKTVQETDWRADGGRDAIRAAKEEATTLEIENWVLLDNARQAYIAEKLPVLLEIVNRYAGKRYGEKTKHKMSNEAKEAGSFAFSFYGDELHIMPTTVDGFNDIGTWSYNDFVLVRQGCERSKAGFIDENNVIKPLFAEDVRLSDCEEYCETPHERAQEIKKAHEEMLTAYETYAEATSRYNAIIPSRGAAHGNPYSAPSHWIV